MRGCYDERRHRAAVVVWKRRLSGRIGVGRCSVVCWDIPDIFGRAGGWRKGVGPVSLTP